MSIVKKVTGAVQGATQAAMAKLVPFAPDSWIPGGVPDPLIGHKNRLIGMPVSRLDGPLKVRGAARFAAEVALENMVYAALVYETIPSGRIATLDTEDAEAAPGVILVMTYRNAPRLKSPAPFAPRPPPPPRAICRSCRTTASTGTASRSRSCSPKRRLRRITPRH